MNNSGWSQLASSSSFFLYPHCFHPRVCFMRHGDALAFPLVFSVFTMHPWQPSEMVWHIGLESVLSALFRTLESTYPCTIQFTITKIPFSCRCKMGPYLKVFNEEKIFQFYMLLHPASSLTPTLPTDVFASTRATKGFIFRSNQSWWFLEQSVLCAYFVTVRSGWLQKVGVRQKKKKKFPFPMGMVKTDISLRRCSLL